MSARHETQFTLGEIFSEHVGDILVALYLCSDISNKATIEHAASSIICYFDSVCKFATIAFL